MRSARSRSMPDFAPAATMASASRSTQPLFMAPAQHRVLHQPPAKRRDHHPVLRGRSVPSVSATSVTTGSGAGAGATGAVGAGGGASSLPPIGARSRTVDRRRGGSAFLSPAGGSTLIGAGAGGGGAKGGA